MHPTMQQVPVALWGTAPCPMARLPMLTEFLGLSFSSIFLLCVTSFSCFFSLMK